MKKEWKKKAAPAAPKKKKGKSRKAARVCTFAKPEGMTMQQWQEKLRRQAGREAQFHIESVDARLCPGEFTVSNPQTRSQYKVVYRGSRSAWNYCSCMDFRTSRLCTCKHLEAVKVWATSRHLVRRDTPAYTSVYLDYRGERRVRIRIGADEAEAFAALASGYFDSEGVLLDSAFACFDRFLRDAQSLSPSFRCYRDAMDYVLERRDRQRREQRIAAYNDRALDALLRVPLFPYQREGVRFAFRAGKAIIADEMGLGKTVQAIATAELMRREGMAMSVLVVCPTSLKYQWKREIERFVATPADVLVIEGTHLKRRQQYERPEPYKIISYNSVCNDVKALGTVSADLLVLDEVQRLKNWNTQLAMAARRIQAPYAVILSGTPLENRLEELYSIVELADQFCLAPYYDFRDRYIVSDNCGRTVGYRNLGDIKRRIAHLLIRRRKKDVQLQMPERTDRVVFVPMTNEQIEAHEELKVSVSRILHKWETFHFLSEQDRQRLLILLGQMRMVCDSTYILDQKTRFDTKVGELMQMLDSLLSSPDEKVVVFSEWERMTRLVAHELDERGIGYAYLHGGVPSVKRKDLVSNFCDDPSVRVFLSTNAGATGLNLQAAATVINLDLPWNPAVLEQRIARIFRIGQRNNIQVINLVSHCAGYSFEESMLGKLKFKTGMFEGVLDGGQDTIFVNNDKFAQLADTLSEMISQAPADTAEPCATLDDTEQPAEPGQVFSPDPVEASDSFESGDAGEREEPQDSDEREEAKDAEGSDEASSAPAEAHAPTDEASVARGMKALAGLAQSLKSEVGRRQLADALVRTDEATGESALSIPVPDKQTVLQLFGLLGKLLG